MKKLNYAIITVLMALMFFSCNPKSGRRMDGLIVQRKVSIDSFITQCILQYPDFESERVNKEGVVLSYYMLIADETTYNLNPLTWQQVISTHDFDAMSEVILHLNTKKVGYKIHKEDSVYHIEYRDKLFVPILE